MTRYTKEYIAKLLDKYMDGTSTLEEEDVLAEYFRGQDIPQEWADYQQLFQEIEAMKPQPKARKRWMGWSVAAAVAVLFVAITWQQTGQQDTIQAPGKLTAQADSIKTQQVMEPPVQQRVDSSAVQKTQRQPVQTKKRRLRKPEPTMTDIDKTYALMAKAEQEVIEAQLAAHGYIPVMQEDGTIIYIHEQTELLSYEE